MKRIDGGNDLDSRMSRILAKIAPDSSITMRLSSIADRIASISPSGIRAILARYPTTFRDAMGI